MKIDIFEKFDAHIQSHRQVPWEGTFRDYLTMVIDNPLLAQHAHARIYHMLKSAGVHVNDEGKEHYAFFERDLFGIDEPLAQVVEYFKAAAMGSDVGRRILLLYGPPSSGKSQLVILLKRGLEAFTHTDEGAIYAIADCPQHEDPLNVMPHALRQDFRDATGTQVEGELCPVCTLNLRDKYQGDMYRVPVKRLYFSEKERVGIGTFVPSDPKSQDISELVGSMDLSAIGDYGSESDPRAYRFDGELNIANRGLMEFIEMLKADERFLYVLLTLSQEKNIKTGRFPLIYADECVISHTNETEFNEFLANKKSEALHDRMIMVRIPYNLKVSQEERIYEKLLCQTNMQDVHIAPHTLRVAATFAVLSRLEDPKTAGLTLAKKLKLYDGEDVEGFRQRDVKMIREQTEREGMDGISPRFVINRISTSLIQPDTHCINPIDTRRAREQRGGLRLPRVGLGALQDRVLEAGLGHHPPGGARTVRLPRRHDDRHRQPYAERGWAGHDRHRCRRRGRRRRDDRESLQRPLAQAHRRASDRFTQRVELGQGRDLEGGRHPDREGRHRRHRRVLRRGRGVDLVYGQGHDLQHGRRDRGHHLDVRL
jgi:serine protein kinase